MNEGAKTGIFWGVAVVMVAIATFVAWPRSTETDTSKLIGKQLFPDFEDPLVAASMKIVTYDDEQGALSQFEVVKDPQTGIWKMPTHAGYPADAEEQMRYSATALFDLSILDVPSRNAEDHAEFGVLEPDPEDLKVGDEGVGRLVDFRDEQGQKLATLVIGNEVPNAPQQRYVRKPTQDVVYVVELDPSRLSTRFVDWIDRDLLGLTAFDMDRVTLNNYTASFAMGSGQVSQNKKFEAELKLDGANWNLEQLVTFKEGVGVPKPLGEDQVLNTEKLNQLKRALDDLEIAGVGRKPEGMSANLKADQSLTRDQNTLVSLLQRGFIPVGSADSDQLDILAANGELVVTQKNGVEYVLRFGETAENSQGNPGSETAPSGSNRYLLVTARLNESQIPVPDLEESPETIEELDAKDDPAEGPPEEDPAAQPPTAVTEIPAEATDAEPADDESMNAEEESSGSTEPGTETPGEEPNADDAPAEDQSTADDDAGADADADAPADSETPADPEESDPEDAESDEADAEDVESEVAESSAAEAAEVEQVDEQESVEEVSTESSPADGQSDSDSESGEDATDNTAQENEADDPSASEPDASESSESAEDDSNVPPADGDSSGADDTSDSSDADTSDAESDEPEQPEETEQEKRERLEAAQERIAKENQRKMDEREEKIQQARQRVAELNARFADWYYEISDATFGDLLLSQNELIISEDEAAEQQQGAPGGFPQGVPQGGFPGGAAPQFGPPGAR